MPGEDKKWMAAIHEAGHAIAAMWANYQVTEIVLPADEDPVLGFTGYKLTFEDVLEPLCAARREVEVLMAGTMAERRGHPDALSRGDVADELMACERLRRAGCPEADLDRELAEASTRVARVIDRYWRAVVAVATELQDAGVLSSMQAKSIARGAGFRSSR